MQTTEPGSIDWDQIPKHEDPALRWALIWIDPADGQQHVAHAADHDRDEQKRKLEKDGLTVHMMPQRPPAKVFVPPTHRGPTAGPRREVYP